MKDEDGLDNADIQRALITEAAVAAQLHDPHEVWKFLHGEEITDAKSAKVAVED